ncbi:cytochrome P450 [Chiua virens]|nr:cytochrome P450 [Chiua virens]
MGVSLSITMFCWAIVAGIALTVVKFILDKALEVQRVFSRIKDYPGGEVIWLNPLGAMALMLGTTFPRPGMTGYKGAKFSLFEKFGSTTFTSVRISTAQQFFWTADSEAIKTITLDRNTFQKDVETYEVLNVFGPNIVSTDESEWKRHRSVVMSAFNEANVALVWSEALRVMTEWFGELDAAGPDSDITLDLVHPMTTATFCVIVAASFGIRIPWSTDSAEELGPGRKLTFRSALFGSVENVLFKALIPEWFYKLSSLVKVPYLSSRALFTRVAFDDIRAHMGDLVASARADIVSGKHIGDSRAALLRNLVEANMDQDVDLNRLTEEELFADIFILLFAGHETSAHTLCFVFVLLALHPDVQQKVYEEVCRALPADVPITQLMANHKGSLDNLEYTAACIRESLRVVPTAPRLVKNVHTDTVLPTTYFSPGSKAKPSVETGKDSIVAPAGSVVVIETWGLHMNPLYWGEDAAEFKPERFLDTESYQWPRDAYLPFSGGARACIGQRFAFVEMMGIVASVVRRYRVLVPDDLAKKSLEEQKEALLTWTSGITLTPLNPRVKLSRRE